MCLRIFQNILFDPSFHIPAQPVSHSHNPLPTSWIFACFYTKQRRTSWHLPPLPPFSKAKEETHQTAYIASLRCCGATPRTARPAWAPRTLPPSLPTPHPPSATETASPFLAPTPHTAAHTGLLQGSCDWNDTKWVTVPKTFQQSRFPWLPGSRHSSSSDAQGSPQTSFAISSGTTNQRTGEGAPSTGIRPDVPTLVPQSSVHVCGCVHVHT